MKWNIITFKNGERKNHFLKTKQNVSCYDVSIYFSLKYNGAEGEILEIVPIEE